MIDDLARRTYLDTASTHLLGYASLRYGTAGIERAWDELLIGLRDPNPLHDVVNDVLQRPPEPHDLVLTVDHRLQAFAAAQLGGSVGAVVALDPATGEVLAMTSSPTFDATAISGDPAAAEAPWLALQEDPGLPLVNRALNGVYVPGSVMKVLTAAAALDAGVITPETTFPTQPQEEVTGFVVNGFTITEHDLAGVPPALWDLSEAMQISSNIYFAHVGLALGQRPYLEGASAFGFCDGLRVGPARTPCRYRPRRSPPSPRAAARTSWTTPSSPRRPSARPGHRHPDADGARGGHDRQRRDDGRAVRRPRGPRTPPERPVAPGW